MAAEIKGKNTGLGQRIMAGVWLASCLVLFSTIFLVAGGAVLSVLMKKLHIHHWGPMILPILLLAAVSGIAWYCVYASAWMRSFQVAVKKSKEKSALSFFKKLRNDFKKLVSGPDQKEKQQALQGALEKILGPSSVSFSESVLSISSDSWI